MVPFQYSGYGSIPSLYYSDNVQTTRLVPKLMALEGFKRRVLGSIGLLKGKRKIDEETVKELSKSLRRALLEADFNVRQAKELTERVERGMVEEEPRPGVRLETHAMNLIYSEMVRILGPPRVIKPHNQTVLMVGLYGQGKTTTTAKLADWWRKSHNAKVAVIEADVHRPGAFEQLSQLLEGTEVEVYGEPGAKIASEIVRNGLKKVGTADVVIIDTAGRDSLDGELKDELLEIASIANASERFLVIDAQVGQAAGPMAETFHELVGVTGTIVTKLDGTARGGGALSAVSTTGAPIVFVGEGERIGDIEKFESDRFISRLLGMGDIKGLIDLAPEDLDEQEAMRLTKRLMSGRFTLTDMYAQMEMMSKIGTLDKVLSHLPDTMFGGMGNMGVAQKRQMQTNLDKYRIVMDSMTQEEKDDPLLLKSSRIRRIARGSGCEERDVKELLTQWNRSKKMMRGFRGDRKMRRQMQSMMGLDDELDLG
jgi:signal recognition particle subunit SRP54